MRLSTLTPAEREDREIERSVRPPPKTKPPRHDLRRNRIDLDSDSDINEEDRDLSLNYKVVGMRLAVRKVPQGHKPKWPGDYWKTPSAWGVWPPGAKQPTSAPDEESARTLAEGEAGARSKDPEEDIEDTEEAEDEVPPKPTKEDPHDRIDRQNEVEQAFRDEFQTALGDDHLPAVKDLLRLQSKKFRRGLKAYQSELASFGEAKTQRGPSGWAKALRAAADQEGTDPDSIGRRAAAQAVMSRLVSDPADLAGVELKTNLSPKKLAASSKQAFRIYREMPAEIRKKARKSLADLLKDFENDPRRPHLQARIDGLALASYLHRDDVTEKEIPTPSPSFQTLVGVLSETDKVETLLLPPEKFFGPEGRTRITEALTELDDQDIPELLAGGPFEELGKVFAPENEYRLGPAQLAVFRDAVRTIMVEDSTSLQGLINQTRHKDRKKAPSVRQGFDQASKRDLRVRNTVKTLMGQIRTNQHVGSIEKTVSKLILSGIQSLDEYLESLVSAGEIDPIPPNDPYMAKLKHALQTGDVEVLSLKVVDPDSLPGLSSPPTQKELPLMSQQKKASVQMIRAKLATQLDLISNSLIRGKETFGLSAGSLKEFIQAADRIADQLDGGKPKLAADFNPDEIGEEVSGPLEDETPNDKVFPGEFTQQENRELSELIEEGKTNPPKTNPEPRGPRPGLQASLKQLELTVRTLRKGIQAGVVSVSDTKVQELQKAAALSAKALKNSLPR